MEIQMKITGLTIDMQTNMPIVILKDLNDSNTLTVWIGIVEASAIAMELEGIKTPRPMTHDLIVNVIKGLNAKLEKAVVTELRDNTFYAELVIGTGGGEARIDTRTSDAIAVALRMEAPIFVEEEVLEKSRESSMRALQPNDEEKKKWSEMLENLGPEYFGKYKM